jgi:ammonium transporter, Amt family
MKLTRKVALLAAPTILSWALLGSALQAQEPPPARSAPPVPAEAAAPLNPEPTLEQRVAGLEAYLKNGDPAASLKTAKDKAGESAIPTGLTSPSVGIPGPGHTAWMMTSTALVLFMTLPGLALFYGGLVRKKNVLSVCAQCLGCAGLVTVLWWAVGYSLVYGKNFDSKLLGGSEFFFFRGVTSAPNTDYALWVPQNLFACYELMFAIITPALIVGAIAERMKYMSIMLFIGLWMFVVYFPMAHMVWGITGLMNGIGNSHAAIKAIDFAGGTVVHMTSGWSALILCMIVGKRVGFGKEKMAPHNMVLVMVGTGMLWVGWYGFNAGSALGSDGIAATAFTSTTLAAASAGFFWALIELIQKGHASILGFCSGIVAGLVVVTPACGFITPTGAIVVGFFAALIPYIFVVYVKAMIGYDDALDTFGIHAVGGTIGSILTGFLATADVNPNLSRNLADIVGKTLFLQQLKAVVVTLAIAVTGSFVLGYLVRIFFGVRPSRENETTGLDLTDHQEEGYII